MTMCVRNHKEYEYISVTIFNTDFYNKYFRKNKWICIEGHIHVNEYKGIYTTEIVADEIHFIGDPTEIDKTYNDFYEVNPEEVKKAVSNL